MTSEIQAHHAELMEALKEKHSPLIELIGEGPVVFLDIPVYDNIGDLLIFHGTLTFFEQHHIQVKHQFSAINYDENKIRHDSVIVFQGGGNFGDLYPLHQSLREEIIRRYPHNRIVILPQSIHFESVDNLKRTIDIFSQHPDLHICVRDTESQAIANKMTSNVYLMPDMAHQLYPMAQEPNKTVTSHSKPLFINRTDKESKSQIPQFDFNQETDWYQLVKPLRNQIEFHRKYQYRTNRFGLRWINDWYFISAWIRFSYELTQQAIDLYRGYDFIVTNRLHGHILACLMNKRNEVLDNSYKKNSRYVLLWTTQSELVKLTRV